MSTFTELQSNVASSAYEAAKAQVTKTQTTKTQETSKTQTASKVSGKTIGNPTLSDKAKEYYEELKKKYSDMDFVLVSEDKKEQAEAIAGTFKKSGKTLVLINEDKIEKMAEDQKYRKQYEDLIGNAQKQIPELEKSLGTTQANVQSFGIRVNDNGTTSFFAVVDKSLASQKERIAKHAEAKQEEKKAAAKKAEQHAQKEDWEERIKENRTDPTKNVDSMKNVDSTKNMDKSDLDQVTFTASSIDELLQKINDYTFAHLSDNVQTEAEKAIGQHIDFRG